MRKRMYLIYGQQGRISANAKLIKYDVCFCCLNCITPPAFVKTCMMSTCLDKSEERPSHDEASLDLSSKLLKLAMSRQSPVYWEKIYAFLY